MWPGVVLAADGSVSSVEPGTRWADHLRVGDRWLTIDGERVRRRPIDEALASAASSLEPTALRVLGADGEVRTVWLPGRLQCGLPGCVMSTPQGLARWSWGAW